MENIYDSVRKLYLSGNQSPIVFKEKQKFSPKDLLQCYVDDALPSAPLQLSMLMGS